MHFRPVPRKVASPAQGVFSSHRVAPTIVQDALRAPGHPLDIATRARIEPNVGHDFSHVRVHRDAEAAASAQAVEARAYTLGRDVVFGAKEFAPQTAPGLQLLTHELAHVLQNERRPGTPVLRRQKKSPASFAGVENIPERRLREHKTEAPELRPVGGEMVEGAPITPATCDCEPSIKIEERRIDDSAAAFRSCFRPGMLVDALYACAKKKLYTPLVGAKEALNVPAAAEASSSTGEITLASGSDLGKRLRVYGHPENCWHLIVKAGVLKHEIQHLEDFDQIARGLGASFFAEFTKLQGDPERLEKLREQFPRETAAYELRAVNKFTLGASKALRFELNAFKREKEFFTKVRAALGRVCTPHVPPEEMPESEQAPRDSAQEPVYQPRTSFESELVESTEAL